jgi:protein SCO1/2
MRKFQMMILGMMLLSWALASCSSSAPSFRGTVLDPGRTVQDFSLTDQNGQVFRLSDAQGKVVLLFFGYTFCPDVCPTTLGTWKQVHDALGKDAENVRFVFITVDPERDTAEQLKGHVQLFNEDFIGLTGSLAELTPVYQDFGVFFEKDTETESAAGYLVNHTASAFVIGPDGVWRLRHSFGTPEEDIVHDIQQLLKEAGN